MIYLSYVSIGYICMRSTHLSDTVRKKLLKSLHRDQTPKSNDGFPLLFQPFLLQPRISLHYIWKCTSETLSVKLNQLHWNSSKPTVSIDSYYDIFIFYRGWKITPGGCLDWDTHTINLYWICFLHHPFQLDRALPGLPSSFGPEQIRSPGFHGKVCLQSFAPLP